MSRLSRIFAPKEREFFDLFEEAGNNAVLAAGLLEQMLQQWPDHGETLRDVVVCEQEGDRITYDIIQRLNHTFVTPFDREDIHELSVRLDDVVDGIQAVAETFVIYAVKAPTDECRRLAVILRDQGAELAAALRKLDGMKGVGEHLERVTALEHEADALSRAAVGRLFRDGIEPLEVIKWRDIYQQLEDAIDAAEDAAEAIERMLHKGT
jgi:uncharacterized protein